MAISSNQKKGTSDFIPSDWIEKALSEIAIIEGGYAFSSRKFAPNGRYQVIKMSNLYGGKLDLTRSPSFVEQIDGIEAHYLLKKGDILLTLTGTTGKKDYGYSCRIENEASLLLNQRLARIVASEELSSAYLSYQLASPFFLNQFFEISKGGTGNQTNVGTSDISKMFVPLPPTRAEQEAIANALSDADAYIESLEKLIEKKRLIKKGAMQELLTGKRRLPGFSGEWTIKRLGDSCSVITKGTTPTSVGASFTATGVNFIKVESISSDGQIQKDVLGHISEQTDKILSRSQLKKGDLLISIAGALGRAALVTEDLLPANTNQALAIARFSEGSELLGAFVFHCLKSAYIKKHIDGISVQGAQANLSLKDISELPINAPLQSEQLAIVDLLNTLDSELVLFEANLAKARLIKQGMMQELLTGRIRLI